MIANWKEKVGGMKESPVDPRDYQVSYKAISLPEEYNTNPSNYIHDQGSYNNCAAHALSSYIEILLKSEDKEFTFPYLFSVIDLNKINELRSYLSQLFKLKRGNDSNIALIEDEYQSLTQKLKFNFLNFLKKKRFKVD